MKNFSKMVTVMILSIISIGFVISAVLAQDVPTAEVKKPDPCTLLTKGEIEKILGKPVKEGKLNANANPVLGAPCEFVVSDTGVFSLWLGDNPQNTYDRTLAAMAKNNMKTTDAPGIGDRSFYSYPGYGMLQLNTWKGTTYYIITIFLPGLTEEQLKDPCSKLMKLAVTKN